MAATWSDAASYYVKRATDGWNNTKVQIKNDPGLLLSVAGYSDINNSINNNSGPLWTMYGYKPFKGVQLGPSWLNGTACVKDMVSSAGSSGSVCNFAHDSGSSCEEPSDNQKTCDTGWCADMGKSQDTEPSSCSNNDGFKTDSVTSVQFINNASSTDFGTLTVMVTVDLSKASYDKGQTYEADMPNGAMQNEMASASWSGTVNLYRGMTSWEAGKIFSSTGNLYGYGSDATKNTPTPTTGSLDAKDTVSFNSCYLGQTLTQCEGCTSSTCCGLLEPTRPACFNGLEDGYCSKFATGNNNKYAALFNPFAKYFNVLVGEGKVLCESSDDASSCVVFNGIVARAASADNPFYNQFAYTPNPYKDPTTFSTKGPILGVPVTYSLMYSANGSTPSAGSYLVQFLNPDTVGSPGTIAPGYKSAAGFNALGLFWDRLNSILPNTGDGGSKTYMGFVQNFYGYAVTNCFLLSLYQMAPFASKTPMLSMFAFFRPSKDWKSDVVDVWNDVSTGASTILKALTGSDFFLNSQPTLGPINESGQIQVKITVPALLLPWTTNYLGELLISMFPKTGTDFKVTSSFSTATTYAQIAAAVPSVKQSVFQIVPGSSTVTYYSISDTDPTPKSGQGGSKDGHTATIGAEVTFKVQVAKQSMTLLFYLYYLSQNKMQEITTYNDYVLSSAPTVQPVPTLLNWASSCAIMDNGQCLNQDGYSVDGAALVNNLFLNKDSAVCKCIYPSNVQSNLSADAVWDNAALCFNTHCQSNEQTTVDLKSILASDGAGKCPTGATAVAEVVNGAITNVTVVTTGSDYTQIPVISFTGSVGKGATATAVLNSAGGLSSINVLKGGTGYTDSVVTTIEPGSSPDVANYNCTSQCKAYINIIENEVVDLADVNLTKLSNECNFNITDTGNGFNDQWCFFAIFAMLIACMPLFYGAAAIARPKVVTEMSFYAPVLVVFFVMLAAAAYMYLDLQGLQHCGERIYKKNYFWPASKCQSRGLFGYLPKYDIPEGFCVSKQSYCQCSTVKGNERTCPIGSCGCSDDSCCSDVGLCTDPNLATTPYKGRQLMATVKKMRFRPIVAALSGAIAVCAVPAAVVAFWYGSNDDVKGKPYVAAVIGLIVLAICSIPMFIQGFVPRIYKTFVIGVSKCVQLSDYPKQLVWTANTSAVYNVSSGTTIPSFVKNVSGCSSCCSSAATKSSVCADQCLDTKGCACAGNTGPCRVFPPPNIVYDTANAQWTATYSNGGGPTYINDSSSMTVYAGSGTKIPGLYSRFTNANDSTDSFDICGVLNGVSSCADCACSSLVKKQTNSFS